MEVLDSLDAHRAVSRPERRKHDKGAVSLNNLAHLVHSAEEDAIDLGGRHRDILGEDSHTGEKLVDPKLSLFDGLGCLARDQDIAGLPTRSIRRAVAVALGKRRRKVDGRVGHGFNELDVLAVTTTQDLVQRRVEFHGIDNSPQLHQG